MIAIVGPNAPERSALAALCASHDWNHVALDGLRAALRLLHRAPPRVWLLRHQLRDDSSDDILTAVKAASGRVIVLLPAAASAELEARQIALGADCVLRDPVRVPVLLAHLARYRAARELASPARTLRGGSTLLFAGATLNPLDRSFRHRGATVTLTPREVQLAEILFHAAGEIVDYDTLYADILGRRFGGETANMRVLLGKLAASAATLCLNLRDWIEVIPKTGYRYRPAPDIPFAAPARDAHSLPEPRFSTSRATTTAR